MFAEDRQIPVWKNCIAFLIPPRARAIEGPCGTPFFQKHSGVGRSAGVGYEKDMRLISLDRSGQGRFCGPACASLSGSANQCFRPRASRWITFVILAGWFLGLRPPVVIGQSNVESRVATSSSPTNAPPRRGFGAPVALQPDDKPAFPDPPAGFDQVRPGEPRGRLEFLEYDSKTVGTRRRLQVYLPPNFSPTRRYPVVYLLHGIGGDETEWERLANASTILDNLIREGKAVSMIVVMPNGRAQPNDRPEGNVFQHAPAFARFERDLLDDVIPAVESRYPVNPDREHRALAGLSMGGGQALNFGLAHLDVFAWVGAFAPAPNTRPPAELIPDPAGVRNRLKLLWLACGNKDGLLRISQQFHAYLKQHGIPHVWHVDSHGHDAGEWKSNLYWFAQHVFR